MTLEGRLLEQQGDGLHSREQYIDLNEETLAENSASDEEPGQSSSSKPQSDGGLSSPRRLTDVASSKLPTAPGSEFISELMRADLYVLDNSHHAIRLPILPPN